MRAPKPITQLSWSDRFTIIAAAKVELPNITEEDILKVFAVDKDELAMANECLNDGVFKINDRVDAAFYIPYFRGEEPIFPEVETRVRTLPESVSKATTPEERLLFAAKPQKKSGRSGNNIQRAFNAIPTEAVPVEEFAAKHRVSLAVLRQYKRFDKTGRGQVNVRKNKETGVIMIWRSAEGAADV